MKLRTAVWAVAVLPLFLSWGCANPREMETLKDQVRIAQKSIVDLQKRTEEHAMRLEGVDNSLQMIEQRLDDNTERIENLKAGLAMGEKPALAIQPAVTPQAPYQPAVGAAPKEGVDFAPRAWAKPEDLYDSAYRHFKKGECGEAILEFQEYVANYGNTELADNAQYWIGECYYDRKDFPQAAREFEKVEKIFPKGNKVPAAKLKGGLAYREMGKLGEAVRQMEEVISRYPNSEEALLAREKLRLWKP